MNSLELQGLTCGIGKNAIVGPIDFTLNQGEIGLLLGPNGSGKSTILKTVVGILKPISGIVSVRGSDISKLNNHERAKAIAWVPQHEPNDYAFTVHEYVAMARLVRSKEMFETLDDLEIVQLALEQSGCKDLEHRLITELSGGERQRVMIARALAQEANVILLDEPVSHLDVSHQVEVIDLIHQLVESGKSVLLSVHDFVVASALQGKVLLINKGKVEFQGPYKHLETTNALEQAFQHKFERVQISDGTYRLLPIFTSTTG